MVMALVVAFTFFFLKPVFYFRFQLSASSMIFKLDPLFKTELDIPLHLVFSPF